MRADGTAERACDFAENPSFLKGPTQCSTFNDSPAPVASPSTINDYPSNRFPSTGWYSPVAPMTRRWATTASTTGLSTYLPAAPGNTPAAITIRKRDWSGTEAKRAETSFSHTAYYADVPRRVWTTALDILSDMIAQPLLRPEDIEAEREIIQQEIDEWHSSPHGLSLCLLPTLLWPGHPLGHDQLGTRQTLQSMNTSLLQTAHSHGYARSRCVLFVSGDLEPGEVMDEVGRAIEDLSDAAIQERRSPASYGDLPAWKAGTRTVQPTTHDDSALYLLFPISAADATADRLVVWTVLDYLITAGDLGSPLNRIVREESQLAYSPEFVCDAHPDGGYWGLAAQTSNDTPDILLDTFYRVLHSDELRSQEWFEFVTDSIRGAFDMHDPSPGGFTDIGANRLTEYGCVWSDEEMRKRMLAVSHSQLIEFLEQTTRDTAHEIVFQGQRTG